MLRKTNTNKTGFTIIEVVITIAIGAAVMALVLNAVQGARRSQRNTNRQADVSAITAAVNQFNAARNKLPTTFAEVAPYLNELAHYRADLTATTPTSADISVDPMPATPGLSTTANSLSTGTVTGINLKIQAVGKDGNADKVAVIGGGECKSDSQPAATGKIGDLIAVGSIRQMIVLYRLEADPDVFCEEI